MIERKALIFNIQKYNMYDGPGVRTIVFFKGCPLRCLWCSNPEGQLVTPFEVLFKKDNCIHCGVCVPVCPQKIQKMDSSMHHSVDRSIECIGCRKCVSVCPSKAINIAGEWKSIVELLKIIEEDLPFYEVSGGGVTLGGGEALAQPEAVVSLLTACRQRHIHTAMETSGYARPEVVARVAEVLDYWLFDIKHMDSELHYRYTGVRNETILHNVQWLFENQHNVKIRVPLLKGVNNDTDNICKMIEFLKPYLDYKNFMGIDILPYHKMGVNKYGQLDKEYPMPGFPGLSDEDLQQVKECFDFYNVPVSIVKH